jgi:hypothetical protein
VITSLDSGQNFRRRCDTVVVNAHGCGVIVPVQLKNKTAVEVELISSGGRKTAKIVLVLSVIEGASWLLGIEFDIPEDNFWEVENPPADWRVE